MAKRVWYLPDKYPETRKDRSNSDWSALLIIIWRDDGVVWHYDDMTNWSWWSLSYFGIRRDVVSVLSSNHFSSQQLDNYPTTIHFFYPTMPILNSHTFQSASGVNTITRPTPRRSGGDYPSGQQVVVANLVLIDWRLICHDLDPWYGFYQPPFDPGVQDSWNGQLLVGSSPLQPWRVGEASRTRTNWSSSEVPLEDH